VVTVAKAVAKQNAAANAASAIRRRMTLSPMIWRRMPGYAAALVVSGAVKPILFVGESPPRLRHTQVAPERRLAFSAFRKPQAVLRVIPEQV